MPKGQRKRTNLKRTPIQTTLLLVQFMLIKIGDLPINIVRATARTFLRNYYSFKGTSRSKIRPRRIKFKLPKLKFPSYQLPKFHRSRGRPRNSWFIPYYLNKFRLYFKKRVSRKTKFAALVSIVFMLIFLYTRFILNAAYQLPSPDRLISPNQPLTTEFYDRNGKLLYRLYEGRNRSLVQLDEIPKYLIDATIAAEDKNFYSHFGVDFEAVGRALYHNFLNGKDNNLQGASTITQQLVKNVLLTPEKTYSRKIKEIILSLWAESKYSKKDILQMYFNEAPYGGPTWGIKAAAHTYFGKEPKDLALAESAYLAGLPASPTQFSPYGTHPQLGKLRQIEVLERMVEEKYISRKEAQLAREQELVFQESSNNILAPHFVFYVKDLLSQTFGPRVVSQGGLKITTTLDLALQQEVEKIVKSEVEKLYPLNVKNGAAMVTDPTTGRILAMVGSRDYHYPDFGNFNVTTALRQPGSSIKVITYATAFKEGFSPGNTILDTPVSFKDGVRAYSPQNYDGTFHGPVSIRQALGSSYNVPAVRMAATVGIEDMIKTAQDLGISTFDNPSRFGLSLTLGGGEVKMIDMMAVYGALSQLGRLQSPTPILKVTDSAGNVLDEYRDSSRQAIQPEIAYLLTSILSDNRARTPAFGSSSLLHIPSHAVAVKTGTSDNKRDNWTFGYTSDFVVGVWVGNNDNTPMNPTLTSGVTGAAPIWRKITDLLLKDHPATAFVRPPGIAESFVDGRKDLAVSGSIPKSLVRIRTDKEKIIFSDSFSTFATSSASRPGEQAAIKNESAN